MYNRLWKSVEKLSGSRAGRASLRGLYQPSFCGESGAGDSLKPLRACSACAGDYEDPDRTAWTEETEEDETPSGERVEAWPQKVEHERAAIEAVNDDEFPAKET
jgi:hypothetical protein